MSCQKGVTSRHHINRDWVTKVHTNIQWVLWTTLISIMILCRFFCLEFLKHSKRHVPVAETQAKRENFDLGFMILKVHYGPLHVLWRVSFGCWVTWSISSWQKYFKSVYFPKAEWWLAELLFLSLNNWGLNFLQNELARLMLWSIFSFKNLQDWKVISFLSFSGER